MMYIYMSKSKALMWHTFTLYFIFMPRFTADAVLPKWLLPGMPDCLKGLQTIGSDLCVKIYINNKDIYEPLQVYLLLNVHTSELCTESVRTLGARLTMFLIFLTRMLHHTLCCYQITLHQEIVKLLLI